MEMVSSSVQSWLDVAAALALFLILCFFAFHLGFRNFLRVISYFLSMISKALVSVGKSLWRCIIQFVAEHRFPILVGALTVLSVLAPWVWGVWASLSTEIGVMAILSRAIMFVMALEVVKSVVTIITDYVVHVPLNVVKHVVTKITDCIVHVSVYVKRSIHSKLTSFCRYWGFMKTKPLKTEPLKT